MSSELSVKEFSFISYLLFYHSSCDHFASAPFRRFQFKWPNAPDDPDHSPSTTIVCISDSLQLKEEGDLHREDMGGMMMGLYIGGRWGVTWWWWRGVAWWHDDVSSSLGGRSSLQDLYYISGYCIPLSIRQFGQFSFKVYKGILDGVGWLSKKFYQPIFIGGRRI